METPTEEIIEAMSIDDILFNMSEISSRYIAEREALGVASDAYHKKYRRTRLFLTYGFLERFEHPNTLEFIKAKPQPVKLFEDDKTAIVELECEGELAEYKRLKHQCETSEAAFDMFAKQLSWHQTVKRSDATHDQMTREIDKRLNQPG